MTNCGGDEMLMDNNNKKYPNTLVIDALGIKPSITAYINDCRKDIQTQEPTINDKKWQNIEFVGCRVNGWPSIFLITVRNVKAHTEELLGYYGSNYYGAIKNYEQFKNHNALIVQLIDNNILKGIRLTDNYDLT